MIAADLTISCDSRVRGRMERAAAARHLPVKDKARDSKAA